MEVSFSKTGEGSVPVETIKQNVETPVPGVKVETTTTAVATTAPTGSQLPATRKLILGDHLPKFSDVILPRLNIVQAIGNLKDTFQPGELVFNQSTVLYTPPKIDSKTGNVVQKGTIPVTVYFIGKISERFAEVVKGGFGGLIVNTEEEVRANGGTLSYQEWKLKAADGMRRFQPIDDCLMLVERPEVVKNDGLVFNFTVEGKQYVLAAWAFKGAAYTAAMKRVVNYARLAGILKEGGYPSYAFSVATRLDKFDGGKEAYVPVVVPVGKTSEAVLKFIYEVAGTPV